eukprot:3306146-Rhodomonas_salina.1
MDQETVRRFRAAVEFALISPEKCSELGIEKPLALFVGGPWGMFCSPATPPPPPPPPSLSPLLQAHKNLTCSPCFNSLSSKVRELGFAGGGKTALAREVARQLGVVVISLLSHYADTIPAEASSQCLLQHHS